MTQKYPIREDDWPSVRKAIQKLGSASGLGITSSPIFAGLTLTGLDASEFVFTDANKALSSINVPLVVQYGGTGAATLTDHSILVGSGTGAITAVGTATNGQLPIGSTGNDPVLAGLTGTANQITVTNGAGSITLSTPQDIHTGASPTFAGLTSTGAVSVKGFSINIVAKTAAYTATSTDDVITCGAGNETFTIDLPTTVAGKTYYIKNVGTGVITVDADTTGSTTIDGDTTQTINQYECLKVVADASVYWAI